MDELHELQNKLFDDAVRANELAREAHTFSLATLRGYGVMQTQEMTFQVFPWREISDVIAETERIMQATSRMLQTINTLPAAYAASMQPAVAVALAFLSPPLDLPPLSETASSKNGSKKAPAKSAKKKAPVTTKKARMDTSQWADKMQSSVSYCLA